MKKYTSIQTKLVVESALKLMLEGTFDCASISSISSLTKLESDRIKKYFETDDMVRMSAMKYAAVQWVEQIRAELHKLHTQNDKLYYLVYQFISGSQAYPQSLSLYIDVWKKIRDPDTEDRQYLCDTLLEIYQYYASFFAESLSEAFNVNDVCDIDLLAWIMVVISDGIHIQSLLYNRPNMTKIATICFELLKHYMNGGKV